LRRPPGRHGVAEQGSAHDAREWIDGEREKFAWLLGQSNDEFGPGASSLRSRYFDLFNRMRSRAIEAEQQESSDQARATLIATVESAYQSNDGPLLSEHQFAIIASQIAQSYGREAAVAAFCTLLKIPCRIPNSSAVIGVANPQGHAIMRTEPVTEGAPKAWERGFFASAENSGLSLKDLNEIIASSDTHEAAKDKLIDALAKAKNKDKPSPWGGQVSFGNGETFDNPEFFMKVGAQAIAALISGEKPEHAAAIEMASTNSLRPILAQIGFRHGLKIKPYMSTGQMLPIVMSGAHSTSDFSNLMAAAFNLRLAKAYQTAPSPVVDALSTPRDTDNLQDVNVVGFGEQPQLDEVPEGAEIKYGTTVDSKQTYAQGTYAKLFAITRKALINDQLSAFNRITMDMGRAAKQTLASVAVGVLTANSGNGANLSDGNPIYTTGRGNKAASGAAIDVTTLSADRETMRTMKGLNGVDIVAATPKYLVVGPAKETEAEQILRTINPTTVADVNPFSGILTPLVEPRLTGNAWRLFADPTELPILEVSYLNGVRAPVVEFREGWNVLGTEWRVVFDFGVGATDWRGTYLNPGN
jgi:hypothetical protein